MEYEGRLVLYRFSVTAKDGYAYITSNSTKREETCRLMEGILFMERNGLNTLTVLSALRFGSPGITSKTPVSTVRKSMKFHPSLK